MTFVLSPKIKFADTPNIDAFGRMRVSTPTLLVDAKRIGSVPDLATTNSVSGTGAATYAVNRACTDLIVGAGVGTAIRQTKQRAIYQPGKSLLALVTFTMPAAEANLRHRVGLFDTKNGFFLERDGTTVRVVKRSYISGAAVDTQVVQASWNVDTLASLDLTKAQIFWVDLEYLGVGRVRCGFVIDGVFVQVHEFKHANLAVGAYMSNPNLPLRWEAEATAGIAAPATLEAICGTMMSEGGYETSGITASADTGTTANTIASGAHEEILAVRVQSSFREFAAVFARAMSIINTTSGPFRWRLVLNPTETGAGAWSSLTNSVMEKNTTRTVTVDTGTVLDQGYVSATGNEVQLDPATIIGLGTDLAAVGDVFSLQVYNLSPNPEDFFGSLSWREIY